MNEMKGAKRLRRSRVSFSPFNEREGVLTKCNRPAVAKQSAQHDETKGWVPIVDADFKYVSGSSTRLRLDERTAGSGHQSYKRREVEQRCEMEESESRTTNDEPERNETTASAGVATDRRRRQA